MPRAPRRGSRQWEARVVDRSHRPTTPRRRFYPIFLLVLLLVAVAPVQGFVLFLPTATAAPVVSMAAASASAAGMGLSDIGGGGSSSSSSTAAQGGSSCSSSSGAPQWRLDLEAALEKNKADVHSRFLQLATVRFHPPGDDDSDSGGAGSYWPHVRWAVFRGFLDSGSGSGGGNALTIATDARSEKVKDLLQNPHAELGWYFISSREQFRLEGTVTVVSASSSEGSSGGDGDGDGDGDGALAAARREAWAKMSDAARLQFAWPAPGAPQPDGGVDPAVFLSPSPPPPGGDEPPPPTFALLVFTPSRVDHLQLRPNPQIRRVHTLTRGAAAWATVNVNP